MRKIELDHWFINRNDLDINLFNCTVNIKMLNENNKTFYRLIIMDKKENETVYDFDNLENAINYVEDNLLNEKEDEIIDILLTKEEVNRIFKNYYEDGNNQVYVKEDLTINNFYPSIKFHKADIRYQDGELKKEMVTLTDEDIENILTDYASSLGYEYDSMRYIGGKHSLYYYDDVPYYEGIKLTVKVKQKQLRKEK